MKKLILLISLVLFTSGCTFDLYDGPSLTPRYQPYYYRQHYYFRFYYQPYTPYYPRPYYYGPRRNPPRNR